MQNLHESQNCAMFQLVRTFYLLQFLASGIFACSVLQANNIYQEVPPEGKYGVNYDAFVKNEGSFFKRSR